MAMDGTPMDSTPMAGDETAAHLHCCCYGLCCGTTCGPTPGDGVPFTIHVDLVDPDDVCENSGVFFDPGLVGISFDCDWVEADCCWKGSFVACGGNTFYCAIVCREDGDLGISLNTSPFASGVCVGGLEGGQIGDDSSGCPLICGQAFYGEGIMCRTGATVTIGSCTWGTDECANNAAIGVIVS